MNKIRRVICVIISFIMIISVLGIDVAAVSVPKLNKTSINMLVNGTTTLKVTGTSSNVTWSSSDTSICTVSKNGKVTAKKVGTAKIYAKVSGKKLSCKVKVVKSYISSIADKTLNKGEKTTLSLKSYNVKSVNITSSDEKIVRITSRSISNGNIKVGIEAVSGGTAFISVTDKNNKSATAKIKITVKAPSGTTSNEGGGIYIQVIDNGDGTTKFIIYDNNNTYQETESEPSGSFAEQILALVNEERAKEGVSALVLDDQLCKAAQIRAEEGGEYFSHTRPDGRICFSILTDMNIYATDWGENLAQGSSTSKGAMKQWMNSPGHRSNILDPDWRKLGVGYDSSTNTWAQLFTD